MGVTVNLPNTFSNGVTADAGQVNANNTALVNALQNAANVNGDTFSGSVIFNALATFNNKLLSAPSSGRQFAANSWGDLSAQSGGVVALGNNTYTDWTTNNYYASTAHNSLGARGIRLASGLGSPQYFDTGAVAVTAGQQLSPAWYNMMLALSGGYKVQGGLSGSLSLTANTQYNGTITFPAAFSGNPTTVKLTLNSPSGTINGVFACVTGIGAGSFNFSIYSSTTQSVTLYWEANGN